MIRARAAAERNTKTATENNRRYCRMKLTMLGTGDARRQTDHEPGGY